MPNTNKTNDAKLRAIFKGMNGNSAKHIQNAYYQATEALRTLAEALELEDLETDSPGGPLIEEHLIALEALAWMNKSRLGAVL